MHPLHQQYSRTAPARSLNDLLRALGLVEEPLRDEFLMWLSEAVEPALPHLGYHSLDSAFRTACQHLCQSSPEEIVVQQVVSYALWLMMHYAHSPKRLVSRPKSDAQLSLFPNLETTMTEPEFVPAKQSLYQLFCESVVSALLAPPPLSTPDENDQLLFLALCEIKGVGYWTLRKIIKDGTLHFLTDNQSETDFYRHLRLAGAKIAHRPLSGNEWRQRLLQQGYRLQKELSDLGISVIHQTDPAFPPQLRVVDDPPYWLFVQGDVSTLRSPSVAIVGTRSPSADGIALSAIIGACLEHFRSPIVSGLAEGIDQAMHSAALAHHVPTIAVLGTGMFYNYPSGSDGLRNKICHDGGAIVTEYLPRDSYSAKNFVRRNRIQAGLSNITIPVEWRERSGTAHTVRFAYEAKRRIVCPRLEHWSDERHSELIAAMQMGAEVFTLPKEVPAFVASVQRATGVLR